MRRLILGVHQGQRGITLVDLIAATAIGVVIITAIAMTIGYIFTGSARSSNHMNAVKQVQNAGYWVGRDAQMAQNVQLGAASGFPVTLTWVGWEYACGEQTCIDSYEVRYEYDDSSGELWRYQSISTNKYDADGHLVQGPILSQSSAFVAHYVVDSPVATLDAGKLVLVVTASVGGIGEERTYEITPRAGS